MCVQAISQELMFRKMSWRQYNVENNVGNVLHWKIEPFWSVAGCQCQACNLPTSVTLQSSTQPLQGLMFCIEIFYLDLLESCKKGCRLELENVWVSEMTNGTWLQLVRSCTLLTVQLVPDFKLWGSWESSRYPRVVRRGRVEIRGYCFLIYNIQTKVLDLMCELIY